MTTTAGSNVINLASYLGAAAGAGPVDDVQSRSEELLQDKNPDNPSQDGSDPFIIDGFQCNAVVLPLFQKGGGGGGTGSVNVRYTTFQNEPGLYNFDTVLSVAIDRLQMGSLALTGAIVVLGAELFRGEEIQTIFRRIVNQPGDFRSSITAWSGFAGAVEFGSIAPLVGTSFPPDFQIIRVAPAREHLKREPSSAHMRQYWLRMGDGNRSMRLMIDWTRYGYREHRASQFSALEIARADADGILKRLKGNDRSVVNEAMAKAITVETIARRLDSERPVGEPRIMDDAMKSMLYEIWAYALGMPHPGAPVPPILRYKAHT